jgi:hypothetical protein
MSNKTLRDMVDWTQQFHRDMAQSMQLSAAQTERERMLLDYLVEHENELARMVGRYGENASDTALNTWVSAYMEQYPPLEQPPRYPPFSGMNTTEIMTAVQEQHDRIINIYEHLEDFVQSSANELVRDLRNLEEQELLRISQSANRLEDI